MKAFLCQPGIIEPTKIFIDHRIYLRNQQPEVQDKNTSPAKTRVATFMVGLMKMLSEERTDKNLTAER